MAKKPTSSPSHSPKFIEPFLGRTCVKGEKGTPSVKFYYDHQDDRYFSFKHTGCGGFGGFLVLDQYKHTPGQPKNCPENLPKQRKTTKYIYDYDVGVPKSVCPGKIDRKPSEIKN